MPKITPLSRLLCLSLFFVSALNSTSAVDLTSGDRHPGTRAVFPESALYENGGPIIDVTRAPFNAKGDGVTDDTQALVKAYDVIAKDVRYENEYGKGLKNTPIPDKSYIIYLPDGEYLVSDTIIYSGEPIIWRRPSSGDLLEGINLVHFIGESREGTIIRLKDASEGFEAGSHKPVISFGKLEFNNVETNNLVENITINTGSENPGAVGIYHVGANMSTLRNLTIHSDDGAGYAGIAVIAPPTMGYHSDITIDGFENGILMTPYHVSHNSFEYISLIGQSKAAISVEDSSTSLRRIRVENCGGPAIEIVGKGGQVFAMDSDFSAASSGVSGPAISAEMGSLYVRDIRTSGYATSISAYGNRQVKEGYVEAFAYPSAHAYPYVKDALLHALNLPVKDEPPVSYPENLEDWAVVEDYIEGTEAADDPFDYSEAVQAAMNSGKPYVIFSKTGSYLITGTIDVPASVKVVNGLFSKISAKDQTLFKVSEASEKPVIFENIQVWGARPIISHEAMRPVAIRMTRGQHSMYENKNEAAGAELFLTNICNVGKDKGSIRDQKVWARFINTENGLTPQFPVVNTDFWLFGYKTEKHRSSVAAYDGSRVEVLGGVSNQYTQAKYLRDGYSPDATFLIENSQATIFACTNGPSRKDEFGFFKLLEVTKGNKTWTYDVSKAPKRHGRKGQYFIPASIVGAEE
ncbi:glycosyl hydrolase family 28-related protein [Coraliomargarita parva]|uniref:glycosyl hydrolase family 28-related protein n=1 Tax=Coraliomargarita parva TaxID=3014050 RepID=UPI0022B394CA|nr:glycosyl hydrolase family 28-related protein [Coraliomargarita parva]